MRADAHHLQSAFLTGSDHFRRNIAVRIDDSRLARLQEHLEQAQFCRQIIVERSMIIEVIARKIGERSGAQPHAIEPALLESMRRRFHRKMRDAIIGELLQRLMQRHRIGRRQRAIHGLRRRNDADRAERCRRMTEFSPYLPNESGDRRLAARTRDGNDCLRLTRIKRRGRVRQRGTRIRDDNARNCAVKRPFRNDGNRAARDRVIGISRPSALLPGMAKNAKPGTTSRLSAVMPPYVKRELRRRRRGRQEIAKAHSMPSVSRRRAYWPCRSRVSPAAGKAAPAARYAAAGRTSGRAARSRAGDRPCVVGGGVIPAVFEARPADRRRCQIKVFRACPPA